MEDSRRAFHAWLGQVLDRSIAVLLTLGAVLSVTLPSSFSLAALIFLPVTLVMVAAVLVAELRWAVVAGWLRVEVLWWPGSWRRPGNRPDVDEAGGGTVA